MSRRPALVVREPADSTYLAPRPKPPRWSERSRQMFDFMEIPVDFRDPVPYRPQFLEGYDPNVDSLLPSALADELHRTARWENGPHRFNGALGIMTAFMTDFCWSSSALEGCQLTRPQTAALFQLEPDRQAVMAEQESEVRLLVNHRRALEHFAFRPAPRRLDISLFLRLHGMLMHGLLAPDRCGAVRQVEVMVTGTAYRPSTDRALLQSMLDTIGSKAQAIRNPVEAAFFLWIHLPYLQAFADGNKRLGRLCANIPLLFGHCAPLSFGGIEPRDYTVAMLGVYERQDVSVAVDLFEWMYRRSMQKYPWMMAEPQADHLAGGHL